MQIKNLLLTSLMMVSLSMFAHVDPIKVDADKSVITWVAKKVTGQHAGTIGVKSGELLMDHGKLTGGSFIIDMTSIAVTDLKAGQGKEKLEGHLLSPDFFSAEANPKATFTITKVAPRGTVGEYKVTGDMNIKGMTKEVRFNANVADGRATATIELDRTDYDVKYGSGSFFSNLGDKTIHDEFTLEIELMYSK